MRALLRRRLDRVDAFLCLQCSTCFAYRYRGWRIALARLRAFGALPEYYLLKWITQ